MKRRDAIVALGTGTVTALAGCLSEDGGSVPAGNIQVDGDDGDEPVEGATLQVSGTGTVEAEPNRVNLRIGVEESGDDASAVGETLAEDAEAVREALIEAGIEDEGITTTRYQLREERRGSGYKALHAYAVELNEVDRAGEVIDVAVEAGADTIRRVDFTIDEETRDALREEALDEAVSEAREEAGVVADAKGMEIVGVADVQVGGSRVAPVRVSFDAATAEAGRAETAIDEGEVTVNASVTVTYVMR